MRTYIGEPGFYAFLRSSELAFTAGLIGAAEHRLRLSFLRELLNPNSEALLAWDWPDNGEREDDEDSNDADSLDDIEFVTPVDRNGKPTHSAVFEGDLVEPELVLRLLTAPSRAFRARWLFHQADPDWFPSVPHGHLTRHNPTKLDPYRGWAFDTSRNNRAVGRETKDFMARLWNEEAFRALATNALRYFCDLHPTFNWYGQRGILNPMHLPRFRRRE